MRHFRLDRILIVALLFLLPACRSGNPTVQNGMTTTVVVAPTNGVEADSEKPTATTDVMTEQGDATSRTATPLSRSIEMPTPRTTPTLGEPVNNIFVTVVLSLEDSPITPSPAPYPTFVSVSSPVASPADDQMGTISIANGTNSAICSVDYQALRQAECFNSARCRAVGLCVNCVWLVDAPPLLPGMQQTWRVSFVPHALEIRPCQKTQAQGNDEEEEKDISIYVPFVDPLRNPVVIALPEGQFAVEYPSERE